MADSTFAPAFTVEINGTRLSADLARYIVDLSIVNERNSLDSLTMTLANPYPQMRWTHSDDASMFKEDNAIKVRVGYVDQQQPLFDGKITIVSPNFPESGLPTVGISGASWLETLRRNIHTRTFLDMTDKQIAEKIIGDAGLQAAVEETTTKNPYLIQRNQSDWKFLVGRARLINFEIFGDGKTVKFQPVKDTQGKVATFVWGRTLKSFNPSVSRVEEVSTVVVRGYDPSAKKEIEARAGAAAIGGSATGKEEIYASSAITTQEEADQLAQALYNERALAAMTGTGAVVGTTTLRAGRVIELTGLGPRFSGSYYITQATHTINSGGYQTTFAVSRKEEE